MKIRKELWFGFSLMALIIAGTAIMLLSAQTVTSGHLGLMMLSLVVVAIMLGFPTAFTLMGMGMIFTWIAYDRDSGKTLTLMVQSAFKVMGNDVLISIPLFVFMGYLVERANLIDKLFKSLHLAMARLPGALAVATLFTCAVFATATGIVGAVVTLMGLLALPQMLKGGYDVKVAAGAITAGGCLGILIPPSVMLIVYGATAGVSVVKLYAGAFFPGLMLAGLYILYVMVLAKLKPALMPPLAPELRKVPLRPAIAQFVKGTQGSALPMLLKNASSKALLADGTPVARYARRQLGVMALPALCFAAAGFMAWHLNTKAAEVNTPPAAMERMNDGEASKDSSSGLKEPGQVEKDSSDDSGVKEPPGAEDDSDAKGGGVKEPPGADDSKDSVKEPPAANAPAASGSSTPGVDAVVANERTATTSGYWIGLGMGAVALAVMYALMTIQRLEIFKMLLGSFFPLVVLISAVLGSIVLGLATPTEAAAVGAFGGYLLAAVYAVLGGRAGKERGSKRRVFGMWLILWMPAIAAITWFILRDQGWSTLDVPKALGIAAAVGVGLWTVVAYRQAGLASEVKESVRLTAKTSAMVCWLFVGSAIFSAAFALLGGQELVERWVLSMNLTTTQFLILSQVIIFVLGWPLEWTEIIVIFMPIFIPLLDKFGVDPLFFGLLVALNLQTAFLSPPVAMAAFYLKGVSPPHVTLNQIFVGMLPFMGIQVVAIILLYWFPAIGMWLPGVLYGK
jgi:TRAP-type mannitol/chloroaromatic compound transport system permease large subunit